jgi:hypothetical protein
MTILIQSDRPDELPEGSYWLQSPGGTDAFYLLLRVYVPEPPVSVTQTWKPPQIVHNDEATCLESDNQTYVAKRL